MKAKSVRRKKASQRGEVQIAFRVTEHQKWMIQQAAARDGLNTGAYVRQAVLNRIRATSSQDAAPELLAVIKELSKKG